MILIASDRFEEHLTPPGHPESPARAEAMGGVASWWCDRNGTIVEPREATRDELQRVHTAGYLDRIAGTAGRAVKLDPDTFTSPASHQVALLAAGAALEGVEHVLGKSGLRALALVRPPGHHAECDKAMGFCLYNSVAVAAADALSRGCSRVAIVDYDVHHGHGTQWIFYDNPRVLYVSTHQYPFYPGTGAADEVGSGQAAGKTFNVPLEAGATDGDYDQVFRLLVLPALTAFAPDLVLVSAGFDAHELDPLGGMRLSTEGYTNLTRQLVELADTCCEGRAVFVTEGGYDLEALAACLQSTIVELSRAPGSTAPSPIPPLSAATDRSRAAIAAVRAAQARFWPTL
jgi:acetoin utilization deacetylase AcuC-like enzyme